MRAYFPGGTLNALASSPKRLTPPATSVHRLRLGLPGYLILFAPLAFEPQRQYWARRPPSLLVFFQISTHSTATPGIPSPSPILKNRSIKSRSWVSPCIKLLTYDPAYAPFTPSDSEQRLHPTYYRGCWHVVSRCLLEWYHQGIATVFSHPTEVHNPKAVIPHAALLRQTFVHCAKFPTAASRRSLGRISVPMWPPTLSGRLPIAVLVGRYPANKLMGRKLIPKRIAPLISLTCVKKITSGISPALARLSRS